MGWLNRAAEQFDAVIVGLGNPGERYAQTRHNAGWWVLDELIARYKPFKTSALNRSMAAYSRIASPDGQSIARTVLVKPTTFMNLSGDSVRAWCKAQRKARLLVVYDDCSMELGRLRLRARGSAGGHNGVKSIIAQLGSEQFDRLKIGVGRPPEGQDSADYVLTRPGPSERRELDSAVRAAADIAVQFALGESMERLQAQTGGGTDSAD